MKLNPQSTAMLVIDMQRDFCSPGGYAQLLGLDISRIQAVVGKVGQLLLAARTAGLMVVHTREGHLPDLSDCPPSKLQRSIAAGAAIGSVGPMGRLLIQGEYGHDFVDELQPLPGEVVIDKPGYGAFYATRLGSLLTERNIEHLILCGVTTEVCVHSTLREAVDRGHRCITVSDATAASQPEHQASALSMIGVEGGIFGRVTSTAACVTMLMSSQQEA
ncbi:isochorismatase family cysteine hydrolase [Rhodoferax sp.]|uniref:cysteine hydrolase family protein n=1 Tax=Rhodoferax sp. TaxID=50421 RepID=UPI002840A5D5|nr:isochorismatase family cysteine hydrolase [Rhodoferax sp.]MDR3371720.1 cysteine hydrolase [Rhodoferax sp.]